MRAPPPTRNAVIVVDESTLRGVPFIPFMLNIPPPPPPKVADEDSLEGAALLVGVVIISIVESETWDEVRLRRWSVAIEVDTVAETGERRAWCCRCR